MSEACFFCGEPSTLLCDAVLGYPIGGEGIGPKGKPYPVTTMEAMLATPHTCDAPMCRACGKQVGHICGKTHDSIDHCPLHAGQEREPGDRLMTAEQIARTRRALHATFRRQRVREDMTMREQIEYWKERALAAEEALPDNGQRRGAG
jgi:hypothetical protein